MSGIVTSCPNCNAAVGGKDECPQCGIFFNKWNQREENVASGNVARYKIANATSSEFNWVILVIVCIIIAGVFYFLDLSRSN